MSRIRINPYGPSESVNLLNAEINTLRSQPRVNLCMKLNADLTRSRFRGNGSDLIVNWGSSRDIPSNVIGNARVLNHVLAVNLAANKVNALRDMSQYGVKTVDYTFSQEEATRWATNGNLVFARTELRGHSGVGIICSSMSEPEDLGNVAWQQNVPEAQLYTKGVSGQHREYRIHVFRGKILFIQQKRRVSGYRELENYSNVVRNHGNGWIYGHLNMTAPNDNVLREAVKAVEALGLDFGAVDVLSQRDEAWVLEVNTAPGLSGDTNRANYANAILAVFDGTEVQGIVEVPEEEVETYGPTVEDPLETINVGIPSTIEEVLAQQEPVLNWYPVGAGLQVGDTVRISTNSSLYGRTNTNPEHPVTGTISSTGGSQDPDEYGIRVNWSNDTTNSYCMTDLETTRASIPVAPVAVVPEASVPSIVANGVTLTTGSYYVFEASGVRKVGEFCELNMGFWDTAMDIHRTTDVTVIKEVNLDD